MLRYSDGRFSRHRRFAWFAFNTIQRARAAEHSKTYVRQEVGEGHLTVEDLRTMIEEGDGALAGRMMRYGRQLRGTRAYWATRRAELTDMIDVIGTPHLFITFSAADKQWEDLHKHMPYQSDLPHDSPQARAQRTRNLNENPHIAAGYLDLRFRRFMEIVIKPLFKVKDFWYRYEWQERGSGHIHGFLWLDDAPNPDDLDFSHLSPSSTSPDSNTPKEATEEMKQKIQDFTEFWDEYISAVNPRVFDGDPNVPNVSRSPISMPREEMVLDDAQLSDVANCVQRHQQCKPGYCQIKRRGEVVCRFDFPFQTCDQAKVGVDSLGRPRFEARRNDPYTNCYNPTLLMLWRANIDIKPVMSRYYAIK